MDNSAYGRIDVYIVQIEQLKRRVTELEAIEREYKRLNGELRQQIDKLFNKLTEMGAAIGVLIATAIIAIGILLWDCFANEDGDW